MSAIVVDTSVWIEFFRGRELPTLEETLREGRALLTPVVAAELISGARHSREAKELLLFIRQNEILSCDAEHWIRVGQLRGKLKQKGFSLSTPDAHILQCALDHQAWLYSFDKIFRKVSPGLEVKWVE